MSDLFFCSFCLRRVLVRRGWSVSEKQDVVILWSPFAWRLEPGRSRPCHPGTHPGTLGPFIHPTEPGPFPPA